MTFSKNGFAGLVLTIVAMVTVNCSPGFEAAKNSGSRTFLSTGEGALKTISKVGGKFFLGATDGNDDQVISDDAVTPVDENTIEYENEPYVDPSTVKVGNWYPIDCCIEIQHQQPAHMRFGNLFYSWPLAQQQLCRTELAHAVQTIHACTGYSQYK